MSHPRRPVLAAKAPVPETTVQTLVADRSPLFGKTPASSQVTVASSVVMVTSPT